MDAYLQIIVRLRSILIKLIVTSINIIEYAYSLIDVTIHFWMLIEEALGLLSALHLVHELRLGPIDFELDTKKIAGSFASNKQDYTEYGAIINECKSVFSRYYENSSVEFVRRQANEVAHKLAKAAILSASFELLGEPLDCIEHTLINEMI